MSGSTRLAVAAMLLAAGCGDSVWGRWTFQLPQQRSLELNITGVSDSTFVALGDCRVMGLTTGTQATRTSLYRDSPCALRPGETFPVVEFAEVGAHTVVFDYSLIEVDDASPGLAMALMGRWGLSPDAGTPFGFAGLGKRSPAP